MKLAAITTVLCLALAYAEATPIQNGFEFDFGFDKLDNFGKNLVEKMVNVLDHVESAVHQLKELVPKTYQKMHDEIDELVEKIQEITEHIEELVNKQGAMHGFNLLGGLTELTGGTKLSTVLDLLSLADKTHKVVNDAKQFVPHLESVLDKLQEKIEKHVHDFASHVLKELGMQDEVPKDVAKSVANKIQELIDVVEEQGHKLILNMLNDMQEAIDLLRIKLPEDYDKVKDSVEIVKKKIHELVEEIQKSLKIQRSFSLLDLAGNMTGGTKLSTAFKVMSLLDKFNTVMQDVRNFQPNAEKFLNKSMEKVANSAQEFFTHSASKLLEI